MQIRNRNSVNGIAAKCLRALSGLFSPNLIDQSLCRILTTHVTTRPNLHDDWSVRLGEHRLYQSSQTFGSYASVNRKVHCKVDEAVHIFFYMKPSSRPSSKVS